MDDVARLRRLPRQIIIALSVFGALAIAGLAWELAGDYRRDAVATEGLLRGQAVAVAEHVAVTLQEAGSELDLVGAEIERAGGPSRMDERELHRLIQPRAELFAQMGSILVTDERGTLIANSLEIPVKHHDLSDRDYFTFHRGSASKGHFISRPVQNRLNGRWRFFMTRRISGPDGSFAGVIGVALDPAYYETFYRSIRSSARQRITLLRTDGVVLVVAPLAEGLLGRDLSEAPVFKRYLASHRGAVFRNPRTVMDGLDRLVAYETVRDRPVVAVVSLPMADVFLSYWRDAVRTIIATAAFFATIAILAAVLIHRVRELEGSIVARRELEREVFRTSKLESLGVLAGGIAHDFNNLLAAILSGVEVAREAVPPGSECAEALEDSAAAARRATSLTRQLLAFSKGGAPVRETTVVAELVRESARFVLHGSPSSLRLELAPDLWVADVDPGQISQVVQNLVLNAHQAMPGGGTIAVSARNLELAAPEEGPGGTLAPGRYVEIAVEDQGVGIPAENLERIFDPFFTTRPEGHGLGLATVYAIVHKHGGVIRARSEPGQGARFTVTLPVSSAGAAVRGPDAARRPGDDDPLPAGLRVLVVEDEDTLRRSIARMIRQLGAEPDTCADGREGVARYRDALAAGRRFDVVLADVTIPGGMSGPEAALAIRALDPGARILLSSGYTETAFGANPGQHGADGYVPKPYTLAQLRTAIRTALGARAA